MRNVYNFCRFEVLESSGKFAAFALLLSMFLSACSERTEIQDRKPGA